MPPCGRPPLALKAKDSWKISSRPLSPEDCSFLYLVSGTWYMGRFPPLQLSHLEDSKLWEVARTTVERSTYIAVLYLVQLGVLSDQC